MNLTSLASSVASSLTSSIAPVIAVEGPNGRHLPVIDEFIWGTLAFLVVVGLFLWKGLGPAKQWFADQKNVVSDQFEKVEAERVAAESEYQQLSSGLGDVEAERSRILSESHEQAATVKADIMARADAEAAEMRAKVSADLGSNQAQASADLQSEMSQLTVASAEAVVESNLDETTQRDLVEAYINQVGSSN